MRAVKLFLTIFLLNIFLSALVTSDFFYSPISWPYYTFTIFSLSFVIIGILCKSPLKSALTPTNTLFGIWCFYVLIRFSDKSATALISIQMITLYLLLLIISNLLRRKMIDINLLMYGIVFITALESIYCILQYFGFADSKNIFYKVTGTWNNPNVTAMFLSLTLPVHMFLLRRSFKSLIILNIVFIVIVLMMLKCRTSLIGFLFSILIYFFLEFRLINWIRDKKNKNSYRALIVIALLILAPLFSSLYNAKKESADGRKFIWGVSIKMASEKPYTGYGYGLFEKEYNLFQSDYIRKGYASITEIQNAGPVIMPHNELIQNWVEGGIIGLFLVCSFFTSLFLKIKNNKKDAENSVSPQTSRSSDKNIINVAYAGVGSFIAMSMVNSTLQIIPLVFMLILYAAMISSVQQPIKILFLHAYPKTNRITSVFYRTVLTLPCIYLMYFIASAACSDRLNKKSAMLRNAGNYQKALEIMPALENKISFQSDYWENYGRIYLDMGQYSKAVICFEKAKKATSLPEVYSYSGICYERMNKYPQAIKEYEILTSLDPSRFIYKMALLQMYLKNRNTEKALSLASEIIHTKPKIPSDTVNSYKKMCYNLLKIASQQKEKILF